MSPDILATVKFSVIYDSCSEKISLYPVYMERGKMEVIGTATKIMNSIGRSIDRKVWSGLTKNANRAAVAP